MIKYRPDSLIQVSSSCLKGNEQKYLTNCISRNWITQGHYVRQFEEKFAEWTERKHAIACSSGTSALHLAILAAWKCDYIDEFVIQVPALTYVATANAANYCGFDIDFVDVDSLTWCVSQTSNLFSVSVDLYDSLARYDSANPTIVDASESYIVHHGVLATTFSFYGNKIITTGEGGMVLTDDDDLAEQIKLYRGQGATIQGDYFHSVVGYNYRMTDLQAAVGLGQLERIDEFISYRRMIIDRYRENLRDDERFTLQGGARSNGWMFALLLPDYANKAKIREQLRDRMIETRPFFRPIPSLPPYYESDYEAKYPIACELYRRGICLPTHVNLTEDQVDYICETLKEVTE